ncbi:hypothetical protein [Nonomuraea sp. NPDC049784]|uniref:hypothetical protein n=1 Tax=Nonomuraea sp. NPDC049784 TaxID=3154361 RepID=UPI00340302A4
MSELTCTRSFLRSTMGFVGRGAARPAGGGLAHGKPALLAANVTPAPPLPPSL